MLFVRRQTLHLHLERPIPQIQPSSNNLFNLLNRCLLLNTEHVSSSKVKFNLNILITGIKGRQRIVDLKYNEVFILIISLLPQHLYMQ